MPAIELIKGYPINVLLISRISGIFITIHSICHWAFSLDPHLPANELNEKTAICDAYVQCRVFNRNVVLIICERKATQHRNSLKAANMSQIARSSCHW